MGLHVNFVAAQNLDTVNKSVRSVLLPRSAYTRSVGLQINLVATQNLNTVIRVAVKSRDSYIYVEPVGLHRIGQRQHKVVKA